MAHSTNLCGILIDKYLVGMISELGPRVSADVERERKLEEERRAELRKRLEEKREREKQGKSGSGFHHGLIQFCRAAIFGTSRRTWDNY